MNNISWRIARAALAFAVIGACIGAPQTLAADITDIGFVDQSAIANVRTFQAANAKLAQYNAQLQRQFAGQARSVRSASGQQQLAQQYQAKLVERQRQLFGPLFAKAQTAIASIASSRNLSVVVDKRIVVYGGVDITHDVIDLLSGAGDPVPPVSTPPPSEVGYVDEQQINNVPKMKSAQTDFAKFRASESAKAQGQMKSAKTDAAREAVLKDFNKTVTDRSNQTLKPLVDQTRNVMGDVAKKRGLLLVVDRQALIYGGTDITGDVVAAIK